MTIVFEERSSNSPYIDTVMRGCTLHDGAQVRPSTVHWHLVLRRLPASRAQAASTNLLLVGPQQQAGRIAYTAGADLLWVRLKLGAYLPHLPLKKFVDLETALPDASSQSFWLHGSAWQFPDYENVETFIERLARAEVLARDPLVEAVLKGQARETLSPRTLRHRFLQATGLSQAHIRQFTRAQQAAELLGQGAAILDVVFQLGYFDQPHLTRSLKRFLGTTPAQLLAA